MVAYLNTLGHLSIVAERSLDKRLIGVFFVTSLSCCRLSLFFFFFALLHLAKRNLLQSTAVHCEKHE